MRSEMSRRWTNCEDCLHHRPPYMGADPVCEDDEAAMYTRGLVEAIQEGRLHCPRQVPGSQTRGRGRG